MLASISVDFAHLFDAVEAGIGNALSIVLLFLAGVFTVGFVIAWVIRRMNPRS